ncbi:MAG: MarR family transcriptional regulator [Candidatus Nanogingivalaceae bacterium]|nr:MAG: MarR family transcriptional regulator [Candidatus Nanogingivalaceae bacterium]QWB91857.1 MAG: MarR family transcriptional regulator [Candidatus Nanogingivalaceae bacterium]
MEEKILDLLQKINTIYRSAQKYATRELSKNDISAIEAAILTKICNSSAPQDEISKEIGVDKAYISRVLAKMEEKNFILKKNSQKDKRIREIEITKLGKEKLNIRQQILVKWCEETFGDISLKELNLLTEVIEIISNKANEK